MPRTKGESHLSAEQLRAWRDELHLTQLEVSYLLGISLRQYQYLESGGIRITKSVKISCILINTIYESNDKKSSFRELFDALEELSNVYFK